MIVKKNHLFDDHKVIGIDFGPSVTEPDQSMSISQILARVQRGLTTGLHDYTTDYDDEDNEDYDDPTLDPDFNEMDAKQMKFEYDEQEKARKEELLQRRRREAKLRKEFAAKRAAERAAQGKEASFSGAQVQEPVTGNRDQTAAGTGNN